MKRVAVLTSLLVTALAAGCGDDGNTINASGGAAGASTGGSGNAGGTGGGSGGSGNSGTGGGAQGGAGGAQGGAGGSAGAAGGAGGSSAGGAGGSTGGTGGTGGGSTDPMTDPSTGPAAGNPSGNCSVPPEAQLEDVSNPRTVIGNGTPASCTSAAVVSAVAKGGVITFNCGPNPITIGLNATAKIVNDTGPKIVIDGGGKVTLSGKGARRILYMNTCDQAQKWTTSTCQNQDHPQLTVQNMTFVDGNSSGQTTDGGGGGAIFVRGGRFKLINSRFFNNVCENVGQDVGGGAVRVLSQYNTLPVYVVNSTFGGSAALGNHCSNGGGLSSIGVSWTVLNSLFVQNRATGNGANPKRAGTPGGGSGGAIYNDGNTFTLDLCGVDIHNNRANEGGGAIFFVSNNKTGTLKITDSTLTNNTSLGFENYPGIYVEANGPPQITNSTVQ